VMGPRASPRYAPGWTLKCSAFRRLGPAQCYFDVLGFHSDTMRRIIRDNMKLICERILRLYTGAR
jgi:hypothetical protein